MDELYPIHDEYKIYYQNEMKKNDKYIFFINFLVVLLIFILSFLIIIRSISH